MGSRCGVARAAIAWLAMSAGGMALAQGTTATAAIGELWVTVDPAVWSVERRETDALISCIAEECLGAVVEVWFEVTDARCDDLAALDGVRAAFPTLPRIAVNMFAWDGFAFFVGEAAPEGAFRLETGKAIYACLEWGDRRYEFQSRVDGPIPDFQGAAVFELLRAFHADPAPEVVLPLADLELRFPANLWEVETEGTLAYSPVVGGLLNCLPPQCEDRVFLSVAAEPASPGEESCLPAAFGIDAERRTGDIDIGTMPNATGDLTFEVATLRSMCRAFTPPHFGACVIHDGVRYSFWTGIGTGCHFGPYVAEDAFLDLIRSLRPVTAP